MKSWAGLGNEAMLVPHRGSGNETIKMYVWVDCCFSMATKMSILDYLRTLIVLSKSSHLCICSLWVGSSF